MAQKKNQILRRKIRVRKKLLNIEKHRLHVYRSSKHIYAAVTSIENDKTLCSFSSMKIKKSENQKKVDLAKEVGLKIAELAISKGVKEVKFDKGPYKYHGRLKSLANAAREKGLLF
ncbi:MAG: 50S ribosomal protein L18 [Pelagibacteraceae bacterium]|nr:50S ribosomal protein L18 [Pelagibacteraceae bacterium]